jgi:hypothetical protein
MEFRRKATGNVMVGNLSWMSTIKRGCGH